MDVAFPYKEAITNAYGLIRPTTTHVASQSPIAKRKKPNCQSRKVNQLHFMVKQVFEAVHFDTPPFNPIVEDAAEWK